MMVLLVLACSGAKESAESAPSVPSPGTVTLNFSASAGVRENATLVDPLAGIVYGSLYNAADVTVTGPIDGAVAVEDVEVSIDLTTAEVSAETWVSGELAPETYLFLGFFDVDGNGSTSFSPDAGDPVTLATTNDFVITEGEATSATASFDLVYN